MGNGQGKQVVFTDEVNLNHFRLGRVVGKGAFGKVRIVERKDTGLTFALKYIRKDEIVKGDSVRNIIRERRMLEQLNHPFICNLRYSFQDIEYMYIIVDLMTGGDLRFHISRKTFTEDAVRFWIAELGCALRYIHQQGIVHRDVKPDNVLLDSEGHIHLADFNVASDVVQGKRLRSKSGTMAYLAPEVYAGTGYSFGADWWSLGVTFYECIYNKRPFDGPTHSALGAAILKANPPFAVTSPPVTMPCMHAISSALEIDPTKRMGSASWVSFTNNPFFRSIDFEALERKELEPVFVPSSDKTNFDATYDLEELLLEEAPLEARARRQKPREPLREDATEKEIREDESYRLIESTFTPFDYTAAVYDRARTSGQVPAWALPHTSQQQSPSEIQDLATSPFFLPPLSFRPPMSAYDSFSVPSSAENSPPPTMYGRMSSANSSTSRMPPPFAPSSTSSTAVPLSSGPSTTPITAKARPSRPRPTNSRTTSVSGGLQVVLGETGSWSDLAQRDTTLPADAKDPSVKPSGVLNFLSRKKGQGSSPKPRERGVLGKEGARVIISS